LCARVHVPPQWYASMPYPPYPETDNRQDAHAHRMVRRLAVWGNGAMGAAPVGTWAHPLAL